jgi:glycosyltransferase involved in cell wall biosynthesis
MAATPRIRVLHAAPSLGLGGTEKTAQLLAQHLDRATFEVALYSPSDGPRGRALREAGIPTYVGPDLLDTLARFRPQIVHLHRAGWPEPGLLRSLRLCPPAVVVETNVFGRHDPTPAARIIDRHLFVSGFCARRYAAVHGLDVSSPAYGVLPNPVDTDAFDAYPWRRDFSRPRVGRISRPDPGKWSRIALEFWPELLRRTPEARYLVVGGTDQAKSFMAERGLAHSVEWREPVEDDNALCAFLDDVSVLAHGNDTGESFGLVIAEAMAAGLPVVTHPAEGLKDNAQCELVVHGRTGLIAANAGEYARAVAWLLDHPAEAAAMGRLGRERAAAFRAQDVARRLGEVYLELLYAKAKAGYEPGDGPRPPLSRLYDPDTGLPPG